MKATGIVAAIAVLFCSSAAIAAGARHVVVQEPPPDPRAGSVSPQDFFRYACVHEYMKAQGIRNFDGSLAYAVEYSDAAGEVLSALHGAAGKYARSLPAPNYKDTEHGLYPVLHACEREAASDKVRALVRKAESSADSKSESKSGSKGESKAVDRPVRRP